MFDTLAYANKLKEAGLTEQQAKAHAEAMVSVINENLATKEDIEFVKRDIKELEVSLKHDTKELEVSLKHDTKELEVSLKHDIKELEVSLKHDIKELEVSLKHDIKELELEFKGKFTLLHWMLGLLIVGVLSLVLKTFFV